MSGSIHLLNVCAQEARLRQIAETFNVRLNVDKRTGIQIQGYRDINSLVVQQIYDVLFDKKKRRIGRSRTRAGVQTGKSDWYSSFKYAGNKL